MAAEARPYERRPRELREAGVPALAPQDLTDAGLERLLPEKLEYDGGESERPGVGFGPRQGPQLLRLLLKVLGAREAVRLAPREAWPAALRETAPGEPLT